MHALVTGVAGFIGSTLAEHLVRQGWTVRGVDRFTAYYEERAKRANVESLLEHPAFTLVEADLLRAELDPLFRDIDVVFHLSGQPGVRLSWADGFTTYVDLNVNVTQRLLEAAKQRELQRFVYASSSSVYGNIESVPVDETAPTQPYSPYGVTKLAGELLCSAYGANFGVPTVSLRYFTVYGPRQRPDMALHRMIEATLRGEQFQLFGDGRQVRDFTYVDDIVRATTMAATADVAPASVFNAAGGGSIEMNDLVDLLGDVIGHAVPVERVATQAGDVRATGGDIRRAHQALGWTPEVDLRTGVERQVDWHRGRSRSFVG